MSHNISKLTQNIVAHANISTD